MWWSSGVFDCILVIAMNAFFQEKDIVPLMSYTDQRHRKRQCPHMPPET